MTQLNKILEQKIQELENEIVIHHRDRILLTQEKNSIAEKLHLVLYRLPYEDALQAIQWANQIQKSLLSKTLQYPLPKELEKCLL